MNTEIYSVNLCVQSDYGKIGTRKNPVLDTFHAVTDALITAQSFKETGFSEGSLEMFLNIYDGAFFGK